MKMLTRDIAARIGATLHGQGDRTVCEAVNDHRRLPAEGGLFLALSGTRTDGHTYLGAAAEAGAAAALVSAARVSAFTGLAETMDLLAVDDVEAALWKLARLQRDRYNGPVVAITGSVGKTTTKAMVGYVLQRTLGKGCVTLGNQNNLLGAPMTVVRLNQDDLFLVLELGSNAPGEIPQLASLAQPDVAIVTAVGAAHLEGFGDLQGVLREKASLARSVEAEGLAIYPSSNDLLRADAATWPSRVESYGSQDGDAVRILSRGTGTNASGRIAVDGESFEVELPIPGAFNLDNAAAAILAARELGVPVADAVAALSEFSPEAMRMEWRLAAGRQVLLDAYNANPDSTRAVLQTLAQLRGGRRVAVLGSMLELGEDASRWHAEVGRQAAELGLDAMIFVGEFAEDYLAGAKAAGDKAVAVADHAAAAVEILNRTDRGDYVLVKGSRGARMEKVLDHVVEEAE